MKSSTYRSATTKCTGNVIRQTNNMNIKQYEIIYSTTVEINTTMALTILTEQRDFVGAGVGRSCGCETAQDDQH